MTSDSVIKKPLFSRPHPPWPGRGFLDPLAPQTTAMLSSLDSPSAASGLTNGRSAQWDLPCAASCGDA